MAYSIDYNYRGFHRDTRFYEMVDFGKKHIIDNIEVVLARLQLDDHWWIIPNSSSHERRFNDLGPYDTIEEAIMYLRLHSKEESRS